MSSTYSAICLSHDPALIIGPDIRYEDIDTFTRNRIEGHDRCDIVIGRFSYPLIEVACLGRQITGPTGCKRNHGGVEWIDSNWLRLLHAASPYIDGALLGRHTFCCWPPERLKRLREELGLPELDAERVRLNAVLDVAQARADREAVNRVRALAGPSPITANEG